MELRIEFLDGRSFAFSDQAQLTVRPLERLSAILAFRMNDVRITEGGHLKQKPMVNAYKGLITISYGTKAEKWKVDLTGQINGPARLPDTRKMSDPTEPIVNSSSVSA